jgi:hypothetical protein
MRPFLWNPPGCSQLWVDLDHVVAISDFKEKAAALYGEIQLWMMFRDKPLYLSYPCWDEYWDSHPNYLSSERRLTIRKQVEDSKALYAKLLLEWKTK